MDGTHNILRYAHGVVYRPFVRGMPPSTEKSFQSFLYLIENLPLSQWFR